MEPGGHLALVSVSFPRSLFAIEAIKRAAYAFMGKADILIDTADDAIICTLSNLHSAVDPERIQAEFRREVLDQDLRITISSETEGVRNAILGLAFSRTGLQG